MVATVSAAPCGSAVYKVKASQKGKRCTLTLSLQVKLNSAFDEPLHAVHTGGLYVNTDTSRFQHVLTPGQRPKVNAKGKKYTDRWKLTPGNGRIELYFPYVRASSIYNLGMFCYGSLGFPATFSIGQSCIVPKNKYAVPLETKSGNDIAFVIDNTESMADDLRRIKQQTSDILTSFENTPNVRVGFVTYNDPEVNVLQDFTNSRTIMDNALNRLSASGGGDEPEYVYSGLYAALEMDWRMSASRTIILLGDAEPKDPEPGTGLTESIILALANSVNVLTDTTPTGGNVNTSSRAFNTVRQNLRKIPVPITGVSPIFPVIVGDSANTKKSFTKLASKTRGKAVVAKDASVIVNAILDAIDKAIPPSPGTPLPPTPSPTSTASPSPAVDIVCKGEVQAPLPFVMCSEIDNNHGIYVYNPNVCGLEMQWKDKNSRQSGKTVIPQINSYVISTKFVGGAAAFKLLWYEPLKGSWASKSYTSQPCDAGATTAAVTIVS